GGSSASGRSPSLIRVGKPRPKSDASGRCESSPARRKEPHRFYRHCGLHVILTEFHESSRLDRQLFGRAGRQGDLGSHQSIVSLEDELCRRFANKALLRSAMALSGKELAPLLAQALRRNSQASAERQHAAQRRQTLTENYRLGQNLGFAGTE